MMPSNNTPCGITQLAGQLRANTNLQSDRAANVIINEARGLQKAYSLKCPLEVFGQKTQVIMGRQSGKRT